ncbi:unnamed protein product [Adineta ricciae]|uniref:Uncharacterized protein n=1 Tax=Adineta ricciae TaxID=249248 RepID=A0A815BGT9_ADIRI|nr:unnamed protein product [Adineta ricciae]
MVLALAPKDLAYITLSFLPFKKSTKISIHFKRLSQFVIIVHQLYCLINFHVFQKIFHLIKKISIKYVYGSLMKQVIPSSNPPENPLFDPI